jgi:hypothetical protein
VSGLGRCSLEARISVPYAVPVPVNAAGGAYGEPAPLRFRLVSAHPGASCGVRLWGHDEPDLHGVSGP